MRALIIVLAVIVGEFLHMDPMDICINRGVVIEVEKVPLLEMLDAGADFLYSPNFQGFANGRDLTEHMEMYQFIEKAMALVISPDDVKIQKSGEDFMVTS